jgi:hypothetical protein
MTESLRLRLLRGVSFRERVLVLSGSASIPPTSTFNDPVRNGADGLDWVVKHPPVLVRSVPEPSLRLRMLVLRLGLARTAGDGRCYRGGTCPSGCPTPRHGTTSRRPGRFGLARTPATPLKTRSRGRNPPTCQSCLGLRLRHIPVGYVVDQDRAVRILVVAGVRPRPRRGWCRRGRRARR